MQEMIVPYEVYRAGHNYYLDLFPLFINFYHKQLKTSTLFSLN